MRNGRSQPQGVQLVPQRSGGSGGAPTACLPLLPLHNAVLLPGGFARVAIPASWSRSRALIELLQQQAGEVLVAAVPYLQRGGSERGGRAAGGGGSSSGSEDEAGSEGAELDLDRLHHTGTAARVIQLTRRTQSGGWVVALEGLCRVRVRGVQLSSTWRPPLELYEATAEQLDYLPPGAKGASGSGAGGSGGREQEELARELLKGTRRLFLLLQGEGGDAREAATRVSRALSQQGAARLSDVLGSLAARALPDRLALLSTLSVTARLRMVSDLLNQMLGLAEKAAAGGGPGLGRARRGAGRPGLRPPGVGAGSERAEGEEDEEDEEEDGKRELAALMQKLKDARPPPEVLRAAQREFKRLQRGSEQHPGYAMALSYLETLADLPWGRLSQAAAAAPGGGAAPPPLPLGLVRQRLDEAHYGLHKVKERIVQFVAVQRLRGWDARAPILCFIGPPGVGKTSLARSIAEVLGRPFQRISLGGVRDEAEIRGHRRTYVGAMPGRLVQALRKAGARDPLLLLDEVDKMGRDARGDPAAALLEVLDPEQNSAFVDTYLGLPLDLSAALFVATANSAADIPPPLLDRLEVVRLGGYTREEKVHIAERHLIPRLLAEHGLHQGQLVFPPGMVRAIIEGYTSEAGVRSLGRCLAAVCRHVAVQVVQQREQQQQGQPQLAGGPGGGRGGGGAPSVGDALPEPLPPLEEATAALHSAHSSRGAAAQRRLAVLPPPAASQRLWEQLQPLASAASSSGAALPAGSAEPSFTCPTRKQPRWFGWLLWARHDSAHEHHGLPAAGASPWEAGTAADSGSWEASWRQTAPAREAPLLCGPGSMQILRPASRQVAGSAAALAAVQPTGIHGATAAGAPLLLGGAEAEQQEQQQQEQQQVVVDEALIEAVLGPRRYEGHSSAERVASPGTAAGLVWTAAGGKVQYIECICVGAGRPSTPGQLTLTGQLGDVLEESARIALSWVRAHAAALGLPGDAACPSRRWDVHIHLPAGAVPKDGPSAGITLAAALVSLFTGRCVRADTAMTGELTLRGLVLPVGGLKEKLLAAAAAGMARVLLPARSMPDVQAEVPAEVRAGMAVVPCARLEDVLRAAFDPPIELAPQPLLARL